MLRCDILIRNHHSMMRPQNTLPPPRPTRPGSAARITRCHSGHCSGLRTSQWPPVPRPLCHNPQVREHRQLALTCRAQAFWVPRVRGRETSQSRKAGVCPPGVGRERGSARKRRGRRHLARRPSATGAREALVRESHSHRSCAQSLVQPTRG